MLEVKILVPKIAISNENDMTLHIPETRRRLTSTTSNSSSPFKSIIKTRSSQPQSPSSSTTQSFHTCHSRLDGPRPDQGAKKKEVDFMEHLSKTFSEENLQANALHPRKNRSFTTVQNERAEEHSSDGHLRRTRSYYAATPRRKLARQPIAENISSPASVYGTPKHEETGRYSENSVRLVIDAETGLSVNDQSDMQVHHANREKRSHPPQLGVSLSSRSEIRDGSTFLRSVSCVAFVSVENDSTSGWASVASTPCISSHRITGRGLFSLHAAMTRRSFSLRRAVQRLIAKKFFDYSILFFIALNCITLAMERPSIPQTSFVRLPLSLSLSLPRRRRTSSSLGTTIPEHHQLYLHGDLLH